jgi:hypothetical protein
MGKKIAVNSPVALRLAGHAAKNEIVFKLV